uniref:Uncharacterized protein n=1 Tax=Arundo donax TaxID=35708 RepID=A0A0A8YZH8_ARUDO
MVSEGFASCDLASALS